MSLGWPILQLKNKTIIILMMTMFFGGCRGVEDQIQPTVTPAGGNQNGAWSPAASGVASTPGTSLNTVGVAQRLRPQISSNQVLSGVVKTPDGQDVQVNFVISGLADNANIAVGLSERPEGSGLTNQGRFPTFAWPFAQASTAPYQVELLVRDVQECVRLGGRQEECTMSDGDKVYQKDTRFDTPFRFQIHVGNNVNPTINNDPIQDFFDRVKGAFGG